MKVLETIKTELLVSIDIETVRVGEHFEELSESFQSAWEYKNKQDGEIPDNNVLAEKWEKNSALYAEFSKVCAVSLTYLNAEGNPVCKEFYGEDEKSLLEALKTTLNNMVAYSKEYRLCGHAAKYFDYPYLCKRFIINNLSIPIALDTTHLKPWESRNLCTNELWKCAGTGAGSSLQALCNVLGIPVSKVDLVGDGVGKAYYDGEFSRIGRYCSLDTIATFNVVRKFKQEYIFSFDEVQYITAYSEEIAIEEPEIPVLMKLYNTKDFSEATKTELRDIIARKKPTKKDKEHLKTIIIAHYLERIDVMDEQKVKESKLKTNEDRTKQVNEFIESL